MIRGIKYQYQRWREQLPLDTDFRWKQIFFTGGGSESDNWAVKGTVWAFAREKNVPLSQVEIVCSVVRYQVFVCIKFARVPNARNRA